MKKYKMAICDKDIAYINGFMHYMNREKDLYYMVEGHSNAEQLREAINHNSFDVILIAQDLFKGLEKEIHNSMIVLLVEGDLLEEYNNHAWVYKYQSVLKIYHGILEIHMERFPNKKITHTKMLDKKIILFASPVGRCGKTTLALKLCTFFKHKKTLYINLELFSNVRKQLEKENAPGLSEILYFLKQNDENIYHKCVHYIEHEEETDYIFPVQHPEDLFEINNEEWIRFFQVLMKDSNYEVIVLDTSHIFQNIHSLAEVSDLIVIPYCKEEEDLEKIKLFLKMICYKEEDEFSKKLYKICISQYSQMDQYLDKIINKIEEQKEIKEEL